MEKIYVGKGKESRFGVRISVCLDDMINYAAGNIKPAKNGKQYINLDVNPMKQTDEWGNTHTVLINQWKPEEKATYSQDEMSEIPF